MPNRDVDIAVLLKMGCSMTLGFKSFVIASAALPTLAFGSTCSALIGTCAYYDCVENELLSCGSNGYTLAYGKFYCKKFEKVQPIPHITPHERELFPVEWHPWLQKTSHCLHSAIDNYLDENPASTCSALREAAFASHAPCYTEGDSFCFLPPRQVANIGRIIAVRGFLTSETRSQVSQTARICVNQIDERLRTETSPLSRLELTTCRNSWELIAAP